MLFIPRKVQIAVLQQSKLDTSELWLKTAERAECWDTAEQGGIIR